MNYPKLKLALMFAFALTTFSCEKEHDLQIIEASALLYWSGHYAVDGCGYKVQVGEKIYKPENEEDIDASFETEEPTTVKLKFVLRDKKNFQCGMLPVAKTQDFIHIISVVKQ